MLKISDLFDLNDTIAADLFEGKTYAWEVLGEISDYILKLGTDVRSTQDVYTYTVEGDFSNAAFLDAFNHIGSQINVQNLSPDSLQGDKVYKKYFDKMQEKYRTRWGAVF